TGYLNRSLRVDLDFNLLRAEVLFAVAIGEKLERLVGAGSERERAGPRVGESSQHGKIEMTFDASPNPSLCALGQFGPTPVEAGSQLPLRISGIHAEA